MKISKINVKKVQIPLIEPFKISLGTISSSMEALVEIETDEGLVGYGEGAAGILITGENLEGTVRSIEVIGKNLIGIDPLELEKIYWIMDRASAYAPCAKAAIDIACHDLIGKIFNQPLYKILGGHDNKLDTDITVGINEPEITAAKAKKHIENGFDTIKVKVGSTMEADIKRIRLIRSAIGAASKIRIDANQAWSAKEAVRMLNKLAEFDIELVEQPVRAYDIDGLEFVTKNSPIPVMADESVFTSKDAMKLVQRHAVDYVNIKLMKCGGLREAIKINTVCEAAGVECMLGCMAEESNIGVTAAASLGAAVKNITRADLDSHFSLKELPFKGGVQSVNGKSLVLSEAPGLGLIK
ncbi:MAG: hypothetical protein H6Q74_1654 [Firmicutes bacterium]|nr:hypothetical protein [Bacillota bacterium]